MRMTSVTGGTVQFMMNGTPYYIATCEGIACDGHQGGGLTVYMQSSWTIKVTAGTTTGTFQAYDTQRGRRGLEKQWKRTDTGAIQSFLMHVGSRSGPDCVVGV
jgi:hypothetical protein